jgi:hypothetical protein
MIFDEGYPMSGYVGTMAWQGYFKIYVPLYRRRGAYGDFCSAARDQYAATKIERPTIGLVAIRSTGSALLKTSPNHS